MKRRAYDFSALVIWLLGAVTILSFSVEKWMMPRVFAVTASVNQSGTAYLLPRETVLFETTGFYLFEIIQDEAAPSKTIVQEKGIDLQLSDGTSKKVQSTQKLAGKYVRFSSKALRPGDAVIVEKSQPKHSDFWIAFSSGGTLPQEVSREATTGDANLLYIENTPQYFMEDQAKSLFLSDDNTLPEGLTVYSLSEIGRFLEAVPSLAGILSLLLLALILWAYSFCLSKNAEKHRTALFINCALGAALLAGIALLLSRIDLPSSLLPQENILDFGHYAAEFSQILAALQSFAAQGNQIAANALSQAQTALWASPAIVLGGAALGVAIVLLEREVGKRRNSLHLKLKMNAIIK